MSRGGLAALLAAILWGGVISCHSDERPEVKRLQSQIQELEHQSAAFEGRIQAAKDDPGLKGELTEERELLHSRLERYKDKLKLETSKK